MFGVSTLPIFSRRETIRLTKQEPLCRFTLSFNVADFVKEGAVRKLYIHRG
jgi:hypothetical protein